MGMCFAKVTWRRNLKMIQMLRLTW